MSDQKELSNGCPSLETLATYLDGKLTADVRACVEAHLAACSECRRLISVALKTEDDVPSPLHPDEQ
jgi:anti-sigma factor RsiW